jgi:hypothetical protein
MVNHMLLTRKADSPPLAIDSPNGFLERHFKDSRHFIGNLPAKQLAPFICLKREYLMLRLHAPLYKFIIVSMRSDPKPDNQPGFAATQGSITLVDSDRPYVIVQKFEMERWMKTVTVPKLILFFGDSLNIRRQGVEAFPKLRVRP